jgi:hypothetical protein
MHPLYQFLSKSNNALHCQNIDPDVIFHTKPFYFSLFHAISLIHA